MDGQSGNALKESVTRLQSRLRFCQTAAEAAGRILSTARQEGGFSARRKDDVESVTSVDEASDRFLRAEIQHCFPSDEILSEEAEGSAALDAPALWIIDPIDGTVNFLHGLDCVAVAIAYAERGEVLVGVVHAPFRGETYSAIRGAGAWHNGKPIRPSRATALRDAVIGTGFPHHRPELGTILRRLELVLGACQDVRRLGSPALDLCFVADGRLDGFYEGELRAWDIAAAGLIAREAGVTWGHLSPPDADVPEDLYGLDVLCASPVLFHALKELLSGA